MGEKKWMRNVIMAVIGSMQENAMIGTGDKSPSLTSAMGMGGGQIPMIITKKQGGYVWENCNSQCGII